MVEMKFEKELQQKSLRNEKENQGKNQCRKVKNELTRKLLRLRRQTEITTIIITLLMTTKKNLLKRQEMKNLLAQDLPTKIGSSNRLHQKQIENLQQLAVCPLPKKKKKIKIILNERLHQRERRGLVGSSDNRPS